MDISFSIAQFLYTKHGFEQLFQNILIKSDKDQAIFFGKDKLYHYSMPELLFDQKTVYHLIRTDKGSQFLLNFTEIIGRTQRKVVEFMGNEENLRKAAIDKDFIKNEFYSMVSELFPDKNTISLIFDRFFKNLAEIHENRNLVSVEMFRELFKSLNPNFRQLACFQDDFPLENVSFLTVTSRMIWYTVVLGAEMIRTCVDGKIEKIAESYPIPEAIPEVLDSMANYIASNSDKVEKIEKSIENPTKIPETCDIFSDFECDEIQQELEGKEENVIFVQNEQKAAVLEETDNNDESGDKTVEANQNVENMEIINGLLDKLEGLEKKEQEERAVETLKSNLISLRDKFHLAPLIFHQHLLLSKSEYWPYLLVSNSAIPIHRNVVSNPTVFPEFRRILIGIRQNCIRIYDSQLQHVRWGVVPSAKELMDYVEGVFQRVMGKFYVKDMTCPINQLFSSPSISIRLQNVLELRRLLAAHFSDQHVDISEELLDLCFEALAKHAFTIVIDLIPFLVRFSQKHHLNSLLLTPYKPITAPVISPHIFRSPTVFQNDKKLRLLGRLSQFDTITPSLFFRSPTSPCLWLQLPMESDDSHLLEILLLQGLPQLINPKLAQFLISFMSDIRHKMRMMVATRQIQRIADGFFTRSDTPELLSQAFALKTSEFVSTILETLLNSTFPVYSLEWKGVTEHLIKSEWWKIITWERSYNFILHTAAHHHPIWSALSPLLLPSEENATIVAHIRLHMFRFVINLACDTLRYTLKVQNSGNEQYWVKYDGEFEMPDDFGFVERICESSQWTAEKQEEVNPKTSVMNPSDPDNQHWIQNPRSLLDRLQNSVASTSSPSNFSPNVIFFSPNRTPATFPKLHFFGSAYNEFLRNLTHFRIMNQSEEGEKLDSDLELSEDQVHGLFEDQGIRDLTMKELWRDERSMMFYGQTSDNSINSIFGGLLYRFIDSKSSVKFVRFIFNTYDKIQEICGNSKRKEDFQKCLADLLDSEAISLIFSAVKISPNEEDIEKSIISEEIFQKILRKLLPGIVERCEDRENHKMESFAAITARIIWYLVILAVEFTHATWQTEPKQQLKENVENSEAGAADEASEDVKTAEEMEEGEIIEPPSQTPTPPAPPAPPAPAPLNLPKSTPSPPAPAPAPPKCIKFTPFTVKKPTPLAVLLGNGLESDSESESKKKRKSAEKIPLIPYGSSTDSQESGGDSPANIPLPSKPIDNRRNSRWDDEQKDRSPKKSIDKPKDDKRDEIRRQQEEEKRREEVERKRLLEEMDRKDQEDRDKERIGLKELDKMTKSQRKAQRRRERKQREKEQDAEELRNRPRGPIDWAVPKQKDQNDPEDQQRKRKHREKELDEEEERRKRIKGLIDCMVEQKDQKDSEDQQQIPKKTFKHLWDQRPEPDVENEREQMNPMDHQKERNQIVPIEWVDHQKAPENRKKRPSSTIAHPPREAPPRKVKKPVDHTILPKPFFIFSARFSVSSYWPFISVRSSTAEICSALNPKILKNREIFSIFRILVTRINSNAGIFRDAFLRNRKEPVTMEQLIGIMEEMCEKCLEGTTMFMNGMMYPLVDLFTKKSVTIDFATLQDFGRHLLNFFYEQCSDVQIDGFEFNACFEFLVRHIYLIAVDIVPYLVNPVADADGLYHIRPNLPAHTRQTFSERIATPELLGRLCRLHTLKHSLLLRSTNSSTLWTSIPLEHDQDKLLELLLEPGLAQALPEIVRNFLTAWMLGVRQRMIRLATGTLQELARNAFKTSEFEEVVDPQITDKCSSLVHSVLYEVLNCPKKPNFRVFDGPWANYIDKAIRDPWYLLDEFTFTNSMFQELVDEAPCDDYVLSLFPGRRALTKYIRRHTIYQLLRFTVTLALQTIRHVAAVTRSGPTEFSMKFSLKSFETSIREEEEEEPVPDPVSEPVAKKRKEEPPRSVFIPPPSFTPPRSSSKASTSSAASNRAPSVSIPLSPDSIRCRTISSSSSAHRKPIGDHQDLFEGVPEKWRMAYLQVLAFNKELQKEMEIKKRVNRVLKEFRRHS